MLIIAVQWVIVALCATINLCEGNEMETGNLPLSVNSQNVPLMTRQRFAQLIGLPEGVLNAQADKGYWPMVKIGKYSFVNIALLNKQLLEREFKL
ncbi:hypothetical protein ABHF33_13230 [Chitinibacter sp. FCG-7]|uniref:DNA-binding protein n=1 Tax=Chitinibacter mangrovi TaxID=3153927 RepID=A0AAU7F7Z5_9NEIS